MAKCTLEISDNIQTGEVDITGSVDVPIDDQSMPTGSQIMYAYLNHHMPQITDDAKSWFRSSIVDAVARNKVTADDIITG